MDAALTLALNAAGSGKTFAITFDQNTGEYTITNTTDTTQFTLVFKAAAGAYTVAPNGVGWSTRA